MHMHVRQYLCGEWRISISPSNNIFTRGFIYTNIIKSNFNSVEDNDDYWRIVNSVTSANHTDEI